MKKLLCLLIFVITLSICLVSCSAEKNENDENENSESGENNGGGGAEGEEPDNFIYGKDSEIYYLYSPELSDVYANRIPDSLAENFIYARLYSDKEEAKPHEIVVGKVDRDISRTAYNMLERMDQNRDGDIRYLIYSDGSSVAIAYDEDVLGYCLDAALDYFVENLVKEELCLERKVIYQNQVNIYDLLEEVDAKKYEEQWKRLYNAYGPEVTAAMQSFYGIYDGEKLVSWLANLYDPSICVCKGLYGEEECSQRSICGTGGFYFSNSARDYVGFLPDVESTLQALGLLAALGMGSSYVSLLPEWVGESIADFTYNLQDPDGFFYHPQWGKNIAVSRRARDFNWARNILDAYGRESKYPMIDDVEPASAGLTGLLGESKVSAVSKVVLTEGELLIPDHLKTLDAFKNYLENDLDFYKNAYSSGNTLSSQSTQIRARGQEYVDLMFEHLNKTQNAENGLWHKTAGYYAINGLMKISGIYKSFGRVIPNADKSCLGCIDAIMSEDDPSGIVDVWNAWVAITYVFENVRLFAEDGEAKEAELKALLVSRSVDAITATRDKTVKFARDDGSYSYVQKGNCTASQGAPVAVPGHSEGDVNGCMIATTQMIGFVFSGLGMNGYKVDLCGEKEKMILLSILEDLSPVTKIEGGGASAGEPISFDYDYPGDTPEEVTLSIGKPGLGTTAYVVEDPRGDGNVLSFKTPEGSFDSISFKTNGGSAGAGSVVFESEMCFKKAVSATDFLRIEMGQSSDTSGVYRISFRPSGDKIEICDNSSSQAGQCMANYLGASVKEGEWFKIRIEYYPGDGTEESIRAKVYLNGKLLAVSDNYYDYYGKKINGNGKPNTTASMTKIQFLTGIEAEVLLNDVHTYYSKDVYRIEELAEEYASDPYSVNVDRVSEKAPVFDFESLSEGNNLPDSFTVNEGTGKVGIVSADGGKALSVSGGATVNIPVTRVSSFPNSVTLSFDLFVDSSASGEVGAVELLQHNNPNGSAGKFRFVVNNDNGENVINVMEPGKGAAVAGLSIPVGEKVNVGIEYYYKDNVILYYLDGNLVAMSTEISYSAKLCIIDDVKMIGGVGMRLDNISAEQGNKDYNSTMKPKYESFVHDFENGLGNIKAVGTGVAVKRDTAGYYLEIPATANSTVTVPVNKRDDLMNVSEVIFNIRFSNTKKTGNHIFSLVDDSGNKVFSLAIGQNGGKAAIYENTALGTQGSPVAEFVATVGATVRLELYETLGICKMFLNDEYVVSTALVYSAENAKLSPASLVIETKTLAAGIKLDDVVFDRYRKAYIKESAANKEDGASEITFSYSGGNDYPKALSTELKSPASLPTVVEMLKDGVADKVLRYDTSAGGGDELRVTETETVAGAVSYVFSAEIMFPEGSGSSFQIYICDPSGGIVTIYYFYVSGGNINMYTRDTAHKDTQHIVIGKQGEWLDFKFEYYFVDGAPKIKTFVNGEYKLESSCEYARTNMTKPGRVVFYGLSSSMGTMYIDNLSLKGSTATYKAEK